MTRTLMRYDSEVGALYTPNLKLRVAGEKGGYLVRTNEAGFRSEREFTDRRNSGWFRAVMFGDSQTAGDGVPNTQRFSDRLEQKVPGLEVFNYGISGTGPDQQFLAYRRFCNVEHDLLILVVYVENVRRVCKRVIKARDPNGKTIFYSKPYFELVKGKLEPRNIPVPKQIWSEVSLPNELKPHVYSYNETNIFQQITGTKVSAPRLPKILAPLRSVLKAGILRFPGFRMLPEYNTSTTSGWVLLRTILEDWIRSSSCPVLVVTIPHCVTFLSSRNPTRYRVRFNELARDTNCHHYDFLPDLLKIPPDDRRTLWLDWSGHLSTAGHEMLAEVLKPVIQRIMHRVHLAVNNDHVGTGR
ncbi:SGNH/GDSL hydrolase family protein [Methylobacterium sp. J-070]|uniref:SGNH/GDSL hydrolase family protein n=1 Tax=Methylobacterium sp. J-070 TaxID=2836650 RepID=UPI001FBA7BB9|nr:SGNH/GDSL hydrolase family protein [Methylobacterium sp. J-070]MCJ2054459.1 SGNH/GDSL hydrolase family protein [Methylobacterium sp. J-070]